MLKENFVRFPGAKDFPEGPYDLDRLTIEAGETSVELLLQLGWVYDIYLLRLSAGSAVAWELWHVDSAVMHVEESRIAERPPFVFAEFAWPCNVDVQLKSAEGIRAYRVDRLLFSGDTVRFQQPSGGGLLLSPGGWRAVEAVE